ncbi:MAG: hypothetical protein RR431_04950 [Clostridia bacterium]
MLSILYLLIFLAAGVVMARLLLPRLRPLLRVYIGCSLGLLLLMWLPALWAYAVSFTLKALWLSAFTLVPLLVLCWFLRDQQEAARFDSDEKKLLMDLAWMVVPLALLSGYLQYTHCLRLAPDGSYHVGQSTYGDLSLHLAIATSIQNAKFPLQNSLMLGATMAYPYLTDSFATTLMMLGQSLPLSMAFTGTLMMVFCYTGFGLLCAQLCKRRASRFLAFFLLFLNGGLGFFYTLSATVEGGQVVSMWDNLKNVMQGYYQCPTNQPDPNNLRWSNIICDMLVPQRGILGGWTILLPCLNLLLPPLCRKQPHGVRALVLLGLFAGGLPLIHTHSYLALVLLSLGTCAYCLLTAPSGKRFEAFQPWLLFGAVAAALSLPQLIAFTFVQATDSDHFVRFWFNWCNNREGVGMVDNYFWFYLKNIGLPYLLILLALLKRKPKNEAVLAPDIRQNRLLASGAFLIYLVAEFLVFQPNVYDNNKLLYVWFMLCLPMAADYALELFDRLRGLAGRRVLAVLFLITCFLSAGLTVARECVSDYQVYSAKDIQTAQFIQQNTPEHCVFITGDQHLNPVSSLAGRTILCSSNIYLYYHGFNTAERHAEIAAFYANPADNLALLKKYQVQYVYISSYERASREYTLNEGEIERLFPLVFETENGENRVFSVPKEWL